MKKFFKAFGIEPKIEYEMRAIGNNKLGEIVEARNIIETYPPITAEIILKLAALLNEKVLSKIQCCCIFCGQSVDVIKNNILYDCIDHKDEIQNGVREVFNAK